MFGGMWLVIRLRRNFFLLVGGFFSSLIRFVVCLVFSGWGMIFWVVCFFMCLW